LMSRRFSVRWGPSSVFLLCLIRLWRHCAMETLRYEDTALWKHCAMKTLRYRDTVLWRHYTMETLRYGDTALWRHCAMKTLHYGDTALLRQVGKYLPVEKSWHLGRCQCSSKRRWESQTSLKLIYLS
jgi:hypothetical protein